MGCKVYSSFTIITLQTFNCQAYWYDIATSATNSENNNRTLLRSEHNKGLLLQYCTRHVLQNETETGMTNYICQSGHYKRYERGIYVDGESMPARTQIQELQETQMNMYILT